MRDHRSLVAWQVANELALGVYRIATVGWTPSTAPAWGQLRRAALSVPLNLAEGYRWRPGPRWRFHLKVANGSALESAEILTFLVALEAIPTDRGESLALAADRCGRLIWGLMKTD